MKKYLLVKDNHERRFASINYNKLDGFKFKPKNSVKNNGIMVNEMVLINPSFIESVLKRKTKKKLELYLRFIISLIENESNASSDDLREALDGLARYKGIVENKYRRYLDERYANMLIKKIELLEQELKTKIIYYKEPIIDEEKKTR